MVAKVGWLVVVIGGASEKRHDKNARKEILMCEVIVGCRGIRQRENLHTHTLITAE